MPHLSLQLPESAVRTEAWPDSLARSTPPATQAALAQPSEAEIINRLTSGPLGFGPLGTGSKHPRSPTSSERLAKRPRAGSPRAERLAESPGAGSISILSRSATPSTGPVFFEQQNLSRPTCLQHAFNNAWQDHVWELPLAEPAQEAEAAQRAAAAQGADIGLVCAEEGFGHRQMQRLQLDGEQLRALTPMLLDALERMVIYLGTYEMDDNRVQGHYTALLKHNNQWYELDSLKSGAKPVVAAKYLAASLTENSTLLAAVPVLSSPRVAAIANALSQGAFPYACRLLGRLYDTQPIEQLADHLQAQGSPSPVPTLSPERLTSYLQSRGVNAAHHAFNAVSRGEQEVENTLNALELLAQQAQGLLWVRTAPYVIAVRRHNDGWQACMQKLELDGAPFVNLPLGQAWVDLQRKFDEQENGASAERRQEIAADRGCVDFISLDEALPDALWQAEAPAASASVSQARSVKTGEIRKLSGSNKQIVVMEFDPNGVLQCAAFPYGQTKKAPDTKRRTKQQARDNAVAAQQVLDTAEETRQQIQKGLFDHKAHRKSLWNFYGRPISPAPGLSWSASGGYWTLDFNITRLGEKHRPKQHRSNSSVKFWVPKNDGSCNEDSIEKVQDEAEAVWRRIMCEDLTLEQYKAESGRARGAEYQSNIRHIGWQKPNDTVSGRWTVRYIETDEETGETRYKFSTFPVIDSNNVAQVMAALERAKEFAEGKKLGAKPNFNSKKAKK